MQCSAACAVRQALVAAGGDGAGAHAGADGHEVEVVAHLAVSVTDICVAVGAGALAGATPGAATGSGIYCAGDSPRLGALATG